MSHIDIEVARYAGVCYGVERALGMAEKAADEARKPVNTLGPLIHNPLVVNALESIGVGTASSVSEVEGGTLIIRAHGVVPSVVEDARARGLDVLDATCPYVKKVHNAAERLVREGYQLIVVGESGHPEVEGIMGHAGDDAHVVSVPGDLDAIDLSRKVGVVVQTTQTPGALADVVAELSKRTMDLRVINTICSATQERQDSAAELARRVDAMIVVGGKNSGNTRRLAEICTAACPKTHHIEDASEIEAAWFDGASHIGVTAGASTPASHIERALVRMRSLLES
ncbi:4-hydroxy-3-methylbut-2-enyl diphosphate reductase [Collinsella intestinalis]|uniref:4-hydroxy-3-methylbut-2-enyl diphosphate reductase n=1 Tax=Collinsella intestinalis TaxID=147207 RepID=UPI0022E97869|nr:4-hydroxy-3-methylbut-2-enyl diphosphate reductase [Collinsella intestinalis]